MDIYQQAKLVNAIAFAVTGKDWWSLPLETKREIRSLIDAEFISEVAGWMDINISSCETLESKLTASSNEFLNTRFNKKS